MRYLLIKLSLISFIFLNTNEPKTENWYFFGGGGLATSTEICSGCIANSYDMVFFWHYNKNSLYGFGITGKSETEDYLLAEQNIIKQLNLHIPSLNFIHYINDFGSGMFLRLGIGVANTHYIEKINDEIIYENKSKKGLGYVMGCGYSYDFKGKSRYMLSIQYGNSTVSHDYISFVFTGLW